MAAPEPSHECDVVVLGGGAAGLTAAWRAALTGRSVRLIERSPVLGGLAASFEVTGVRVDHGSHRLHPTTAPVLLEDLRGLLGADLQERPRHGRLRLYDRWLGFPLDAGELARVVPKSALRRIVRDAVFAPFRLAGWPGYADRGSSYGGALSASLGPELYGILYLPYAVKLWGLPGERIDVEQARRRVSADSPWKIGRRILHRRNPRGRVFYYPRRGFGQIVESIAEAAVAAGAHLHTSTEVSTVDLQGAAPVVRLAGGGTIRAGHVLSTLPLPLLARLTRPQPPPPVLEDAGHLRLRAMVLVYLAHTGGRWTKFDAHYLPDSDTPVTRISEPANYRDNADDPVDRTVLCAEIPCAVGDPLWRATAEELAAVVTGALARTGLPLVRLAGVEVRRLPHVYPVYATGTAEPLARLQSWADGLRDVTTLGRQGLFVHDNTHHTMAMAYDAVGALASDNHRDEALWAAARERFSRHVVED
ncbi:MAG: protoporphyrinogen/coproporphyrinogen oxidase [Geodermatophilaceae bacterium]